MYKFLKELVIPNQWNNVNFTNIKYNRAPVIVPPTFSLVLWIVYKLKYSKKTITMSHLHSHLQDKSSHEIKLEVCVDSIASAIAAAEGGAQRIELCSALSEGGLTPSCGVLKTLKDLPLNIEIFCMLRPRRGNDFVYSENEMEAVLTDMDLLRSYDADGFVFGALTEDRNIDVQKCRRVMEKSNGLPITFHRAFDLTNPVAMHETVGKLKELGFKRILSSGFRQNAADGSEFLAQLIAKHHRDIIVMPGAGINVDNLEDILTTTKCKEFHSSAKSAADTQKRSDGSSMECDNNVTMGTQDTEPYSITDFKVVRKLINIARSMAGIM